MAEIRGPLGIWSFPLLNMLMRLLNQQRPTVQFQTPPLTQQVTQNNEENWELVRDDKGRLVNVVVHRKVTQNEHE